MSLVMHLWFSEKRNETLCPLGDYRECLKRDWYLKHVFKQDNVICRRQSMVSLTMELCT